MNRQRTLTRTNLRGFVCTYWEPGLQGEDVHHMTLFLYHPRLSSVLVWRRSFSQRHLFFLDLNKMEEESAPSVTSAMGQGQLKDTRCCVAFWVPFRVNLRVRGCVLYFFCN